MNTNVCGKMNASYGESLTVNVSANEHVLVLTSVNVILKTHLTLHLSILTLSETKNDRCNRQRIRYD